jgi:LysM repeat protein
MVRASIISIFLIASIISMKSFKTFLLEQNTNDYTTALYRALISAEHRGVVKDPTKFDKKLYIRTKSKPKDDVSTAYGPGQITGTTIEDARKRRPENFSKDDTEFLNAFVEQGKKMKAAKPDDKIYGYGCEGDLCDEKYHQPYERAAIGVLKTKMQDAKIDPTQELTPDNLTKTIRRWRGAPENDETTKSGKVIKGDPEYYKIVRDKYEKYLASNNSPKTPTPEPVTPEPKQQPNTNTETAPPSNEYTIAPGDTFWELGGGTPAGVKKLQDLNPGVNPNKIKPGQKIKRG